MTTAASSDGATESIPSKLGKFASEQIDKAEVTVTKGVSTVRNSTNTIISKAEDQIITLNKALFETKNKISGGIDTAIKETETQLTGITPELKKMMEYCQLNVWPNGQQDYGHWHYMHYYYAQVMYRQPDQWGKYSTWVEGEILSKQTPQGGWEDGSIGSVYVTAMNTTILQLNKGYLPIYQR